MDPEDTADAFRVGPLSRRTFLQATATATAIATAGTPAATAASGTTTLSFTAATGGSATLAPSGERLVAEVQNVLWSVPRQGGTAVPLTPPGLEPTRPQFSPDGSLLVVCAFRGGGFHLWTLRPDGTGLRQLTDGPWDDRGPAWSPDGTRIAFASERGGDTVSGAPYRIWVVDVRTGELTRLTGRPGQQGPGQQTPDPQAPGPRSPDQQTPGLRSPDPQGAGPRSPDQQTPGLRSPAPQGAGQRSPDQQGAGQRSPDQQGAGQQVPDWQGPGLRSPNPQGAGQQSADPQGPGQQDPDPQAPGRRSPDPQGPGLRSPNPQGAGQQSADPQGPGQQDSDSQAPGRRSLDPQGAGQRSADRQGAGQQDSDSQAPGRRSLDPQGAGQRSADRQGAGQQDSDSQAPGRRSLDPQGAGQRSADRQGAGQQDSDSQAPGRRSLDPQGAGQRSADPQGPGRQSPDPQGPRQQSRDRQNSGQDARWEDFDPAWSPDGERVLFVRAAVTGTGALRAATVASVAADGSGPVTTEHTDDSGAQLMTPAVSPTGRLAYLRTTAAPTASCTLVVDGQPVAVRGDVLPAPPRWADGERLLLTVDGHFRLVDPDAPDRGEEIPFTAALPVDRPRYRGKAYDFGGSGTRPVRALHLPALSPDGRRVAFAALNALWIGGTSGGRAPRKVLHVPATRYVSAPTWTPDGTALVYTDDRAGLFAVRRRDLGTGEETVLAEGGRVFPALSPDGTRLACLDMSGNLVVRDLRDGGEQALAAPLGAGGLPGRPSFSPDGRYVALCDRNRLNHRFREGYNLIRVVDTTTKAAALHALAPHVSLSDRYDSGPVWSPDGRWMAVVAESALWLLPVRADGTPDGAPHRLTTEPADHPSWSADARTLLYLSAGTLRLIDIGSGRTRTVRVPLDHRRPRPADTVVHAGRLWDGTGPDVRDDVDVVIRDGRVAELSPHRAGRRPAAHHVDASERTVIPGLWDAHTHPWQTTYGGRQTALQLAYGITTAVSLGGFAYEQARIREAVAAGALAGPRLLTTGELLDGARVAYSMGRAHRTREGLRRSLARGAALDWDFVKTYVRAPGWVMNEAAKYGHHRLGVRSGSHLCSPGVQLGQDLTTHLQATQRLEFGHATSATGRAYQDVEEIYTATDFHLVATPFTALGLLGAAPALADDPRVTVLMPPWDTAFVRQQAELPPTDAQLATLDREMAVYRRILAGGGLVALGTDQPIVPVGLHLHLALRALHRAGLSPAEALRTATLLPARVFGADADLGTVEEGKLADLTVVDGDPFTDFATLVRTVAVLRGGVLFEQGDLVNAFDAAGARRADPEASAPPWAEDWLEVSRRMRREGCCDPEYGG